MDIVSVSKLEQACASITEFAPKKKDIIRRPQWGEISFEDIEQDIETVFWLVGEVKRLPIYMVPNNVVQATTQHLSQIVNNFGQIDNFSIARGDASSLRTQIANQLRASIQDAMANMGLWLPVLALRAGEIENWVAKMKTTSADATRILQETADYMDSRKKDIDATAQAARAAAGEAGAAEFTHEFRTESEAAKKRSNWWLVPTVTFAVFALVLSCWLMFGSVDAPTNIWGAAYRLGGRVIAFSVLFYAAVWSGRIVLANMHLANVNKHRAVSLQTLRAFHQAAEDPAVKDAVVLEAARAVYENVPSGYISRQATEYSGNSRMLEVIRGATKVEQSGGE